MDEAHRQRTDIIQLISTAFGAKDIPTSQDPSQTHGYALARLSKYIPAEPVSMLEDCGTGSSDSHT